MNINVTCRKDLGAATAWAGKRQHLLQELCKLAPGHAHANIHRRWLENGELQKYNPVLASANSSSYRLQRLLRQAKVVQEVLDNRFFAIRLWKLPP